MPRITEVLDQFPEKELVNWMLRDPKKAKQISEEAKRVGTVTDRAVRQDLGCPMTTPTPPLESGTPEGNCWEGWCTFRAEHPEFPGQVIGMQQELTRGEYVGHPDFLIQEQESEGLAPEGPEWEAGVYVYRPARWGIVDLKCAAQIRPSYWTQVAAYSWLKSPEVNADFLAILRLDKVKGTYEYQELTDPAQIDYEVQIWLYYKALYEHRQRVAERYRTQREDAVLDGSIL